MPRLATFLAAAAVAIASSGLVGCGSSDKPAAATPSAQDAPVSGGSGAGDVPTTSPVTCAELRVNRVDYEELYRQLGCSRQRRTLCRGLAHASVRYDAYHCASLHKTAAQRRAAAKRKAAKAKRKAANAKRDALIRAQVRKAAAKEKASEAKKQASSSGSSRSSTSSSSSSSSGSSSGSSGGSSGGRRR